MTYQPLYISGNQTGLVQNRQEFILPNDAYPILENAYIFRETIRRKQGYELLGRLRRLFASSLLVGTISAAGAGTFTYNIFTGLGLVAPETNPQLEVGSITPIIIVIGAPISQTLMDTLGNGTLTVVGVGPITSATINYSTGIVTMVFSGVAGASSVTFSGGYYPNLPVMGLRSQELNNINTMNLIAFDRKYAYQFLAGWQEYIPGTTWNGSDSNFFWSTNFWNDGATPPKKLFWVTNDNTGTTPDPIRYNNGPSGTWTDFSPVLDAAGNKLQQNLMMLPFRGRMVVFNTWEGPTLAGATNFPQRVRWAAIGNPLIVDAVGPPVVVGAWRDDVRGKGGFLNIPTSDAIVGAGFVRDNLVIYCQNSTWQLRYTGRSISPFQIEKVNTELGSQSTFSAVQFDTSLVGIGDKGIVECDSFKSDRIDVKIPDFTFQISQQNNGTIRVQGIRDFQQKLAYWTVPYAPAQVTGLTFPNRRLVYNYENDSWALFTDSLTTLGVYYENLSLRWEDCNFPWQDADFPWVNTSSGFPAIVGGNQQGFVEYLSNNLQPRTSNDQSLTINGITGNDTIPTVITSINHNMETGQVIQINGLSPLDPFFATLNGNNFGIVSLNANTFELWKYNPMDQMFSIPELDPSTNVYLGVGNIELRDGFSIVSKKFNFAEEGQNIMMGFFDILMDNTSLGAITVLVYINYADDQPVNILPENINSATQLPDPFFNSIIPTTPPSSVPAIEGSKNWQRVYCSARGNFITLEYTLSNAQLVGVEQEQDVNIDAQILWVRPAGRMTNI